MKRDPVDMKKDMLKTLITKEELEKTVARLGADKGGGGVFAGVDGFGQGVRIDEAAHAGAALLHPEEIQQDPVEPGVE